MTKKPDSKGSRAEYIAARKAAIGSRKPPTKKEIAELIEVYGPLSVCPKCGLSKPTYEGFGIRRDPRDRKIITRQADCKLCRNAIDYRSRPRVYNTRNS